MSSTVALKDSGLYEEDAVTEVFRGRFELRHRTYLPLLFTQTTHGRR